MAFPINPKKIIAPSEIEFFEGFGASLLLTHSNLDYLKTISTELCGCNSLPYGGIECGIQAMLSKEFTPDKKYGIICSCWSRISDPHSQNSLEIAKKNLIKHLIKKIRYCLFPKFELSIFSASANPAFWFNCEENFSDFGDGFTIHRIYKRRDMLSIPMMGGNFLIDSHIGLVRGFMGVGIFIFCKSFKIIYDIESQLKEILLKFPEVSQIYGLAGSGSKLGHINILNSKFPISTNHEYCPTLSNISKKIPSEVVAIPELILNGYNLSEIQQALRVCLSFLSNLKDVVSISGLNYNGKIGNNVISLFK